MISEKQFSSFRLAANLPREEGSVIVTCMISGPASFLREGGNTSEMYYALINRRLDEFVKKIETCNTFEEKPNYRRPIFICGGSSFFTHHDGVYYYFTLFEEIKPPEKKNEKSASFERNFLEGRNYGRLAIKESFKEKIGPGFIAIPMREKL